MQKNCEVPARSAAGRKVRLFRAGLICLGASALELIEGLLTGSHVVTFPASALFLVGGVILLVLADHAKERL